MKDCPSLGVEARAAPSVWGTAPIGWKVSSLSWDNLASVVQRSQVWSWESGRNGDRREKFLTTRMPLESPPHLHPPCLLQVLSTGAGPGIRKAGQGRERDETELQSFALFEEGVGRTEPLSLREGQECRCVRAGDGRPGRLGRCQPAVTGTSPGEQEGITGLSTSGASRD